MLQICQTFLVSLKKIFSNQKYHKHRVQVHIILRLFSKSGNLLLCGQPPKSITIYKFSIIIYVFRIIWRAESKSGLLHFIAFSILRILVGDCRRRDDEEHFYSKSFMYFYIISFRTLIIVKSLQHYWFSFAG